MSDRERDEAIAARARGLLDRSADELDPVTVTRLRAARLRALEALGAPRSVSGRRGLLAAAGFGALGLLFAASWWLRAPELPFDGDVDDVEILTAADDLELYDDLEFYRWLADSEAI